MTESYSKSEILAHGSEKRHCCRGIALLLVGWGEHEEEIERLNLMWLDVVLFGLQVLSATQYLTLCNVCVLAHQGIFISTVHMAEQAWAFYWGVVIFGMNLYIYI